MAPASLTERIARLMARPDPGAFEELALEAFSELCRHDAAYRERCERAGRRPGEIADWRAIPPVGPPSAGAPESEDAPALPATAVELAVRIACLGDQDPPPILDLTGGATAGAEELERLGGAGSLTLGREGRLDVVAARSWLAARQRDRRAALVFVDEPGRERLLGALERQDLRFQLAPGSRLVLWDGAERLATVAATCAERFGFGPDGLLGRIGWAGLPTPFFGRPGPGGRIECSAAYPWTRAIGPEPAGEPGPLSVIDLSLRGRPFHLETGAAGWVDGPTVILA